MKLTKYLDQNILLNIKLESWMSRKCTKLKVIYILVKINDNKCDFFFVRKSGSSFFAISIINKRGMEQRYEFIETR